MIDRTKLSSVPRNTEASATLHGRQIPDPYEWLTDASDPAVEEWLQQQHRLRSEFVGRDEPEWLAIRDYVSTLPLYETDYFAVTITGSRCIYAMQPPGAEQVNIYCVPLAGGEPQLLVDPQIDFAEPGWRIDENCLEASPCGRYLVFAVNRHGQDVSDFRLFDLQAETLLDDCISNLISSSVAWKPDSSGFYYGAFRSLLAESTIRDGLYFHVLGTDTNEDACLVPLEPEQEEDFVALIPWVIPGTGKMLLKRYSYRHLAAGLWLMPMEGSDPVEKLFDDYEAEFAVVGVRDDQLYISTTHGAENGRVLSIPLDNPDREGWREVVPPRSIPIARPFPGIRDNLCCICGERLLVTYMEDAKHRVTVLDFDGTEIDRAPVQSPATVIGMEPCSDTHVILSVTSFLQPLSLYRLGIADQQPAPLVNFKLADDQLQGVEVRQQFYTADDGQRIPLYLIGRDIDNRSSPRPVLLYGYGGFGQAITPVFNPDLPVWLKMGGIYALANIRGGGEYGKGWHEAARGVRRPVSFGDFRAAADYLVAEGLTDREHLGIRGISNGGLLVGASVVLHPEKWGAAIAEAPLLDMIAMLQHPGAEVLCKEYGDFINDPRVLETVLAYSPVQNVRAGVDYPAVMAVPAQEDPRAQACQSWKFIAELQHHNPDGRPALLCTVPGEGHVNWSTENIADTLADEMMFLRSTLKGISPFGGSL